MDIEQILFIRKHSKFWVFRKIVNLGGMKRGLKDEEMVDEKDEKNNENRKES